MSRLSDSYSPDIIVCESCSDSVDEWVDIEITNISMDKPVTVGKRLCLGCAYTLGNKIGVDLEEEEEGYFRINQFGMFETFPKDNN